MARQANPQLQKTSIFSRASRNRTPEDLLQELEERARLARGGFSTFAEDTGSQPGFIVPGGIPVTDYMPQTAGQTRATNAVVPPEYPQMPDFSYKPVLQGNQARPNVINSFINQYTNPTVEAVAQTEDGGAVLPDGSTLYSDGTLVNQQGDLIEGVASLPGGYTLYSDGSVRRGGLNDLVQGIFGRQQAITQAFGNYNPQLEPGSGYNLGTDIRTRDLEIRGQALPDDVQVMQVTRDDGTRWGAMSGHQGYGNSVLVRLPSGEMLRFAHLDSLPNELQPGAVISAGTQFIYPGATGNVTGEHLDLEYYDAQGNISDPSNFQGFSNVREATGEFIPASQLDPQLQRTVAEYQNQIANQTTASIDPQLQQKASIDPSLQSQEQPQQPTLLNQLRQVRESGGNLVQSIAKNPVDTVSQVPEKAAEALNIEAEFGVGETLRGGLEKGRQRRVESFSQQPSRYNPYRHLAGNITERIGDTLGIPDTGISEVIAGSPTKQTGQAFATELGKPNESVQPGIRQDLQNIFGDIQAKANQASANIQQGLGNFGENTQSKVLDVTDVVRNLQPGAGVERLKDDTTRSGGAGVALFSRRKPEDVAGDRVVGGSPGGGLLPTPTVSQQQAKARKDTSDPFFSTALFDKLRGFTNLEGEIKDQALSQDIFTNDFYNDPSRVSSVFTGTFMQDPALRRATEQVKQAYRNAYSGQEYDQADVDRILSQLPDVLNYSPNLPEPRRRPQETNTGGNRVEQSNTRSGGVSSGQQQNYTPSYANYTSASTGRASYSPAPAQRQQQTYTPANANYTSASAGKPAYSPAPQQQQQNQSLFDRAKNFAGGFFKRFFN